MVRRCAPRIARRSGAESTPAKGEFWRSSSPSSDSVHEDAHDGIRPFVEQVTPSREPPRTHPGRVRTFQPIEVALAPGEGRSQGRGPADRRLRGAATGSGPARAAAAGRRVAPGCPSTQAPSTSARRTRRCVPTVRVGKTPRSQRSTTCWREQARRAAAWPVVRSSRSSSMLPVYDYPPETQRRRGARREPVARVPPRRLPHPPVGALVPSRHPKDDDRACFVVDPVHDPDVTHPQAPERTPGEGRRCRWPWIAGKGEDRAAHARCRVRRQLAELALGCRRKLDRPGRIAHPSADEP